MMCEEVQEQMAAFVAGDLIQQNADFIKQHLRTCSSCQKWQSEVIAIAEAWNDSEFTMPYLNLVPKVMCRIETRIGTQQEQKTVLKQRRLLRLPMLASMFHYGIAASLTIALFQLGAFEHLGFSLAHMNALFAIKVQSFYQFALHI